MGDNERLGSYKTDSIKYQDAEILFENVERRAALAGAGNENPVGSGHRARSKPYNRRSLPFDTNNCAGWLSAGEQRR